MINVNKLNQDALEIDMMLAGPFAAMFGEAPVTQTSADRIGSTLTDETERRQLLEDTTPGATR